MAASSTEFGVGPKAAVAPYCYGQTLVIAASGTVSDAFNNTHCVAAAVVLPATFTGTALTFQVSADNSTFVALNNDSGAVSITVAQAKAYALPAGLAAFPYFKIVSGSTEGSARSLLVTGKGAL